jgi:hypothetical protein
MEETIVELEEKTGRLVKEIKVIEDKILQLEELFKCSVCKNIKLLVNCYSCDKRICNQCYNCHHTKSNETENVLVYYCKSCAYNL